MTENDFQKVYNYLINPRDSKKYWDKNFVFIDNREQQGTHWTAFYVKDNKSFFSTLLWDSLINFYKANYFNQ